MNFVLVGMRNGGGWVTYLACSEAKLLYTSTEDGIPGKRDELSGSRGKSASVRSAKLTRMISYDAIRTPRKGKLTIRRCWCLGERQ